MNLVWKMLYIYVMRVKYSHKGVMIFNFKPYIFNIFEIFKLLKLYILTILFSCW